LDALEHLLLAPAQALVELVQRAPPVGRVRVELCTRHRERFLERLLQFRAHARERGALVFALGREPVGVGGELHLDVGEQALLVLGELADARLGRLGRTVEILRPRREALLDLHLRRRERRGQRRGDVPLAVGELGAALLRDLALFLHQQRDRVGPGTSERSLELFGAVCRLPLDERAQLRLRVDQVLVDRPRPAQRIAQQQRGPRGDRAPGEGGG